jgi:hypothetical protein
MTETEEVSVADAGISWPVRYGRRKPKGAPALRFASFRRHDVPEHPPEVDYLARLQEWQVLGNDQVGDCNAVTWANMRRLVTATLAAERYPTQEQVWEFYRTQNSRFDPDGSPETTGPGSPADGGMCIQTGLDHLHQHGGPDGVRPVAYAKVDPTRVDEVDAALAVFGCLWLGIEVLDVNMLQFRDGFPWTSARYANVDGGHAVLAGGYRRSDVKMITWGRETTLEASYWHGIVSGQRLVEEAWIVVWPEHLGTTSFLRGVDVGRLRSDYLALTGRQLGITEAGQ